MWKPEDIQINSYQAAVTGAEHHIRITHIPTGIFTSTHSSKSYFRAKKQAEKELVELLVNYYG